VETHLLRSFVVVAEELHFGRAAERLVLSQPALSRQIGRLERDVGAQLFDRGPPTVRITPAGQRLLERGRPLLAELDELVTEVQRLGSGAEVLCFGCPPYARYMPFMAALEARLAGEDPPLELEFVYALSGELAPLLDRGELDAAVLLLTDEDPPFAYVEVLQPRLELLLHLDHPLAGAEAVRLDALRAETLVLWPRETNPELYDAILRLFPAGSLREVVHLAASWDVIMSAVASGAGFSVVMPELWQPEPVGVVSRAIAGSSTLGRLVLAVRRGESREQVRALLTPRSSEPAG
jgi:DNA-binding transcriptional LysR family regulator